MNPTEFPEGCFLPSLLPQVGLGRSSSPTWRRSRDRQQSSEWWISNTHTVPSIQMEINIIYLHIFTYIWCFLMVRYDKCGYAIHGCYCYGKLTYILMNVYAFILLGVHVTHTPCIIFPPKRLVTGPLSNWWQLWCFVAAVLELAIVIHSPTIARWLCPSWFFNLVGDTSLLATSMHSQGLPSPKLA